jgi:hypothetical protein
MENDAMLCFLIGMKIKLQPQCNTWVDLFVDGGDVEWLLRATYLANLARVCGGNLRVGTLVVCHPGTKRLPCPPCFSELLVQPYDNMGSVLIEYVVRVHP